MGQAINARTAIIAFTPTLDTNAYATGDRMGSITAISLPYAGQPVTILGLQVLDRAKQSAAMDLLFFKTLPTVASADNAAIDISDTEMDKCIGSIELVDTEYVALATASVSTFRNVGLSLMPDADSNTIYCVAISRGSPTYAAGSLTFTAYVSCDEKN
jgi:hypothetical protein